MLCINSIMLSSCTSNLGQHFCFHVHHHRSPSRANHCSHLLAKNLSLCNVRSHAECLRRHPISECSASIPDRRRRPGSAPGPPAPVGPGPPPARSSSILRVVQVASIPRSTVASLRVTGTRVRHDMACGVPARSTPQLHSRSSVPR
jgi:hypothetical protein